MWVDIFFVFSCFFFFFFFFLEASVLLKRNSSVFLLRQRNKRTHSLTSDAPDSSRSTGKFTVNGLRVGL